MSTAETFFAVVAGILLLLVIGNIAFSYIAERRNPPIGSFIECEGLRLHYLERGDPFGPCVVLFHGNGSMIQDLLISGVVDRLASRYRVLCFDRPGFGYSQRPRMRIWTATSQAGLFVKALNQLGVRDPVVLGHSWGALVAVAIGLQNDYPTRGLVLASGYYFPTWRWDFWMMSGPAIPVLGDLVRYTIAPIISWAILPALFRKLFAPCSISRGLHASLSFLPDDPAEAAEGGRRGKCVSDPGSHATAVSLFKHPVPGPDFSRNRGPAYRARTSQTSTQGAQALRPPPREECWAHGDLCRRGGYCAGRRSPQCCYCLIKCYLPDQIER